MGRRRRHRRRHRPSHAPRLYCRSYLGSADALDSALALVAAAGVRVTELDVSANELAQLPQAIARLPSLRSLRAKYNKLTALPVDVLEQLPQLQLLDVDGNQVADMADALPRLPPGLRHLSLSSNRLATLPPGLLRCASLAVLVVSNNPLATALPDSLGACPALAHLDVSSCALTALPPSLAHSRTLQRLFCQVQCQCLCGVVWSGVEQGLGRWRVQGTMLHPLFPRPIRRTICCHGCRLQWGA